MKDSTKSNISIIACITLFCVAIGFIGYYVISGVKSEIKPADEQFGGVPGVLRDIVGTRTGTTTVPAVFYAVGETTEATTTARLELMQNTDSVLFNIQVVSASTTAQGGSYFGWRILGSNDDGCDTASTSTIFDVTTVDQIDWFDIGHAFDPVTYDNHQLIDPEFGTDQYATGTSFILTNNIWKCIRVDACGSSTEIWMGMREKVNN